MTTTASSPLSILLSPVATSGNPAAAVDAEATPDAALEGFGNLLDALQQLQQGLTASVTDTATEADDSEGSGGNASPQLGMVLPPPVSSPQTTAPLQSTAQLQAQLSSQLPGQASPSTATATVQRDVAAPLEITLPLQSQSQSTAAATSPEIVSLADGETKDSEVKDDDSADSDTASLAAALPFIAAPPTTPEVPVVSQPGSASAAAAAVSTVEMAAASAAPLVAAAIAATDKASTGANNAPNTAPAVKSARANGGPSVAALSAAGDTEEMNALGGTGNAVVAATLKDLPVAATESDFDVLMKHFEAAPPTPAPTGQNVSDGTSVNLASRTYLQAASNNTTVPVPVGSQGWSEAIADKVMWFSASKISSAEIHLNPPDLGPLQVRVSTQHDQASVVFTSQHAAVRDALDQALPRLRDMMGSQGMHLLDVSVGGQSSQHQPQQQFSRHGSAERGAAFDSVFGGDTGEVAPTSVTTVNAARLIRAGVDAYV